MPQEFWYPVTIAGHDLFSANEDWETNAGGANKNASCRPSGGRAGPMTHDDSSTYTQNASNGPGVSQSYNIDWPGPMSTYDGVFTAGYRYASIQGGGSWDGASTKVSFMNTSATRGGLYVNGGDSGAWFTVGPISVAVAATYRPGAGTWTAADFVDDKTIFVNHYMTGLVNDSCLSTSHWGEISYTPPSGGFAFLLGLAGLMSLQLAGPMTDYTQLEKFLQWRHDVHPRHTILTADEKVTAWDEYKSYRAPRFFYG